MRGCIGNKIFQNAELNLVSEKETIIPNTEQWPCLQNLEKCEEIQIPNRDDFGRRHLVWFIFGFVVFALSACRLQGYNSLLIVCLFGKLIRMKRTNCLAHLLNFASIYFDQKS